MSSINRYEKAAQDVANLKPVVDMLVSTVFSNEDGAPPKYSEIENNTFNKLSNLVSKLDLKLSDLSTRIKILEDSTIDNDVKVG